MLLLFWFLLLLFSSFTYAATPSYVGIEANDTYTWQTTYDEDALEDRIEDEAEEDGVPESIIEAYIDYINVDEDAIKIKIVILDVDDEEKDPYGEDGVRIIYNYYIGYEDADEEWDLEKKDETGTIWDFDDEWYAKGLPLYFIWEDDVDNEDPEETELYLHLRGENPWFVSTKTDWGDLKDELEELYEDDLNYDDVSIKTYDDKNGIEIKVDDDDDDDYEERKWVYEYDDNGVLMYYEESYDGDPIVIVQTTEREVRQFIADNLLWIILGAIGIVAVVIIIIVLIKRR
jgi:hypothetical protein